MKHLRYRLSDSLLKPYGGNAFLKTITVSLGFLAEEAAWFIVLKDSGMSSTVHKGGLGFK